MSIWYHVCFPYKKKNRHNAEKFEMFSEMYMCICQSYDKSPHTHRKTKNAMWYHKNSTKKLRLHNNCGPIKDDQLG